MDALVMERLTSSPRIVDMFGHCALGVITEQLDYDMETTVIPTSGTVDDEDGLKDQYDVNPQNDYEPTEKLGLALEMAKSIAELHGFQDGVIVHDDIQLSQFLIDSNGKLKLNDFNRAEVMLFDEEKGQYCRYRNGGVCKYLMFVSNFDKFNGTKTSSRKITTCENAFSILSHQIVHITPLLYL